MLFIVTLIQQHQSLLTNKIQWTAHYKVRLVSKREKDSDKENGFNMHNFPGYISDICWQTNNSAVTICVGNPQSIQFHFILQNFQGTNYDTLSYNDDSMYTHESCFCRMGLLVICWMKNWKQSSITKEIPIAASLHTNTKNSVFLFHTCTTSA
jgi:hypothetical protein